MDFDFIASAIDTIKLETKATEQLVPRINHDFTQACQLILACKGRVILTGIGKSGHIARKIAATFSSTGTPAFFVHPAEANHGDMGMITGDDIVIALSNSGNTAELMPVINLMKRQDIPLISLTGDPDSAIAGQSQVHLDISVEKEACPLDLAPTASTTVSLVMGDALAVALLQARGFDAQDFARSHPGGALGRQLLVKVEDIMHSGDQFPCVSLSTTLSDAILEITAKGLGMTAVVHPDGSLAGILTDGDLRRIFTSEDINIHQTKVKDIYTPGCKTIAATDLAVNAVNMMNKYSINAIIALDTKRFPVGALNMHDLLKSQII